MAKILIIDDEPDILRVVRFRLQKAGYEVITAIDGEEGLRTAQTTVPDLILLDLRMPKMNGEEVCRKLRSEEKFKSVPIIFLTASLQADVAIKAQEYGADGYLVKPFEPAELLATIRKFVS